jgi:hypothetical protein
MFCQPRVLSNAVTPRPVDEPHTLTRVERRPVAVEAQLAASGERRFRDPDDLGVDSGAALNLITTSPTSEALT